MSNVKCLNPWDIQSKHIMNADGISETIYAGDCRWGGGESYVLYPVERKKILTMNEREMSMMITVDIANTLTDTDYKGCQLICHERKQSEMHESVGLRNEKDLSDRRDISYSPRIQQQMGDG